MAPRESFLRLYSHEGSSYRDLTYGEHSREPFRRGVLGGVVSRSVPEVWSNFGLSGWTFAKPTLFHTSENDGSFVICSLACRGGESRKW
jgi:hypothetical protein